MYVVCTPAHSPSTHITPQVHTDRHTFLKEESSVHYCIYQLFYYVHNVKKKAVNRHNTGVRQQLCSQRHCLLCSRCCRDQHRWVRACACVHQSCIPLSRCTLQFKLEKLPKTLNLRSFLCKGEELIVSQALGNVLQSK